MLLKKWQLILSVAVLSIALLGNLVVMVVWKTTVDIVQADHEKRIISLEQKVASNNDAWREIKINLKNLCKAQGIEYQTGD